MTYSTAEGAVQTLIRTAASFSGHSERVTLGDFRVLDSGIPSCVILYPGNFEAEQKRPEHLYRTYEVMADIMVRFDDTETAAWSDLKTLRGEIVAIEENYPTLNHTSGITFTGLSTAAAPDFIHQKDSTGPVWLMQTLIFTVTVRRILTTGEFA